MKKILKNRKGFTLIELLAVIVILAILVMVAIPAITKILTDARKGTYADTSLNAISSVRQDFLINGTGTSTTYMLDDINKVLEKQLNTSPFGNKITSAAIYIEEDAGTFTYYMCIWDEKGNGFEASEENSIEGDMVQLNQGTKTCSSSYTPPANNNENGG